MSTGGVVAVTLVASQGWGITCISRSEAKQQLLINFTSFNSFAHASQFSFSSLLINCHHFDDQSIDTDDVTTVIHLRKEICDNNYDSVFMSLKTNRRKNRSF